MKYVLFLMMILFSNQAVALNCERQPTCEELNYSKEDNPKCDKNGYILCPYDQTYKKCVRYNCETLGFTQSNKSSWCGKISKCPNDKSYTACKALCEIGDVYYADGTCGYATDYDNTKTPVGVVFYVTDEGRHGKVVALRDLTVDEQTHTFNPKNPYHNSFGYLSWGLYGTDVLELTNYVDISTGVENIVEPLQKHIPELYNGAPNTEILIKTKSTYEACTQNTYQVGTKDYNIYCIPTAALAAHQFYPPEADADNSYVGQGKWYLPALGELMDLYGYDQITESRGTDGANKKILQKVETTLQMMIKKGCDASLFTEYYYWSSNESTSSFAWHLHMGNGYRSKYNKELLAYPVRPILAF